ncbi:MAG: radical SAM protein [bacterium]|nr:radical SAM protein [bacterium]
MKVLLVGPYDPSKGEFSFHAPPLGVWRICGFLRDYGIDCRVYDPNLHPDSYQALDTFLAEFNPAIVGFSMTSLTLPYDLSLVHLAKNKYPETLCIGGGIGATFEAETVFANSPVDYCLMGEGELALLHVCQSLEQQGRIEVNGIPGLVYRVAGELKRNPNPGLSYSLFKEATYSLPYKDMPVAAYWEKMLSPVHKEKLSPQARDERLRDIHSVRLMTSNYCPMQCSFCSYTDFLNTANSGCTVKVVRLSSQDIMEMVKKISRLYLDIKTLIFQDDMFVHKGDDRIIALFGEMAKCRENGTIPKDISFIASCRVDCMNPAYLAPMRQAGFRLIGYGIESFSRNILREYGKENIHNRITEVLEATLRAGIKPFIDIILVSPYSQMEDVVYTLNKCMAYINKGCECAINPSVMPLAGSKMAEDPALQGLIKYREVEIPRTGIMMKRGVSIQPQDALLRDFLATVEQGQRKYFHYFTTEFGVSHFPSRLRSLLFILAATEAYPGFFDFSKEEILSKILAMVGAYDSPEQRTEITLGDPLVVAGNSPGC